MLLSRFLSSTIAVITVHMATAQTLDWKFEAVPRGLGSNVLTWEVSSDGEVVTAGRDGFPVFNQTNGLDGSLIDDNSDAQVSGSFVVNMTAAQKFDSGDFSYENAEPPAGKRPWLYSNAEYFLGVSSRGAETIELDGGIRSAESSTGYFSEAIVCDFDLSNLSIPEGYALQLDGLYLRNTAGAARISFLHEGDSTVQQLTGFGNEPNAIEMGERVFQPAPKIVSSGDRVALWADSRSGHRQMVGLRFSLVKAPHRVGIPEPSAYLLIMGFVVLGWAAFQRRR